MTDKLGISTALLALKGRQSGADFSARTNRKIAEHGIEYLVLCYRFIHALLTQNIGAGGTGYSVLEGLLSWGNGKDPVDFLRENSRVGFCNMAELSFTRRFKSCRFEDLPRKYRIFGPVNFVVYGPARPLKYWVFCPNIDSSLDIPQGFTRCYRLPRQARKSLIFPRFLRIIPPYRIIPCYDLPTASMGAGEGKNKGKTGRKGRVTELL